MTAATQSLSIPYILLLQEANGKLHWGARLEYACRPTDKLEKLERVIALECKDKLPNMEVASVKFLKVCAYLTVIVVAIPLIYFVASKLTER